MSDTRRWTIVLRGRHSAPIAGGNRIQLEGVRSLNSAAMTAAYTDDAMITAQERRAEKRAETSRAMKGAGEERAVLEGVENRLEEARTPSKEATGGKAREEIDLERSSELLLNEALSETSPGVEENLENNIEENTEALSRELLSDIVEISDTVVNPGSDSASIASIDEASIDQNDLHEASKYVSTTSPEDDEHLVDREILNFSGNELFDVDSPGFSSRRGLEESKEVESSKIQELRLSVEGIEIESLVHGDEEQASYRCSDVYDPEGELNFHEAVRAGDAKCVATLLAAGCVQNLDEPDWNVSGDPPLLVAATNHCFPVLSTLLSSGCDPAVRSPRGETALHRVILNGGPGNVLKFVSELLKYGCPPAVKEAGGGLTALHVLTRQLAHAQGSKNLHHNFEAALKTLDLLAKAGPINAKDHQGRSALHILASSTIFDNSHRTEIESLIEALLDADADPALKNDRGETPLHECLECGALNTAFLLIPHTPTGITSRYGETPLHIASRKNYADMVAKLLEHGEDPSVQDAGGNTPLHLASARGFHRTVSLLVTSPLAQLEKQNVEGLTALQVAAESGFINAVRLLLKAGADPSQTVHDYGTTLHRHPDISVLIDHELSRRRQLAA
ncbi:hypothetical protein KM043_005296 [Ampulex compressa]|nr:hypothetical protein KM043_005296 [Ampulex compressa]